MEVKLVYRRRHPCLKVTAKWGVDKVMSQRKIWQNKSDDIHPTLKRTAQGRECIERAGQGESQSAGSQCSDCSAVEWSPCLSVQVSRGRWSQITRKSQKMRTDGKSQFVANRSNSVRSREEPDWTGHLREEFEPGQLSWTGQGSELTSKGELVHQ